ncbi:MAG: Na+/H+ antiporter NhaC [Cyclobacteriaceae bacterium]
MTEKRAPGLIVALIPVIFLILSLSISVSIFGDDGPSGSNQIVLMLSAAVTAIIGVRLGYTWSEIQDGMVKSINTAMPSILILFVIGALSGSWMISGIVPAMIYYGLDLLNPGIFLFAACLVCAIVSVATGSSWTTAATVGIALMGIGKTLGIHEGAIAGAIISGAYFGDKMSPLSDTTNLAPAVAGTDLFTHIRYMTITTFPSISIALIIFLVMGFYNGADQSVDQIQQMQQALTDKFHISGWLFIVPALVVIMIARRIPALPVLVAGSLLGIVFAIIFQRDLVAEAGGSNDWAGLFAGSMISLYGDLTFETSMPVVSDLLGSGGMAGMLDTIWLILSAMIFGGAMEKTRMLQVIAQAIINRVKTIGGLFASTVGTCVFFNITASDQYLAIVVPGRMYHKIFEEKGLAPENLSRTLEDSGTVTSVLVPWNTCGAYHMGVLGVSPFVFAPYCFFNILSPLMTIFFGIIGYKIKRLTTSTADVS